MVVVVFRVRLRPNANVGELEKLSQRMFELVSAMPGFHGIREYAAADGEAVSVIEFDTLEQVTAWREHPEHKEAQERGKREFFAWYRIHICTEAYGYEKSFT